jgi:hypothetical protein
MMQDIMKGKAQLLDYDAICTFYFKSYLDWARFLYDPASKALTSDHDNFMDESQMKMMVGSVDVKFRLKHSLMLFISDEYMIIENGAKVG